MSSGSEMFDDAITIARNTEAPNFPITDKRMVLSTTTTANDGTPAAPPLPQYELRMEGTAGTDVPILNITTNMALTDTGIRVGIGSSALRRLTEAGITLAPGLIAAGTSVDLAGVVLTGCAGGDFVILTPNPIAALEAGIVISAFVTAANTLTVRFSNVSAGGVTPASRQYDVCAIRIAG